MIHGFKWRHFRGEIIPWAVRWYCRYGVSYRDLEEMLEERGVAVDHTTIYRWVQAYAPEIERRLRWHCRPSGLSRSWHVDETNIKVKGRWAYLHRAVDSRGDTVDFHLSQTRNANAVKRLLIKPTLGFKSMKTACATIKGFEAMRSLRKKQARAFQLQPGKRGEVRLVERAFGIGPEMMSELMSLHGAELEQIAIQQGF